ncbi:hypothetical protein CEXT_112431 [Caerostris extrusa]|uniref:Uncharacterized protein n=1 Tax=Caerostris extrusa TaxID=172846 RepID=A0AAV4X1C2_CAEEX|nr:hypothetical protein CEXT_112431 [Caerostris extrusa]
MNYYKDSFGLENQFNSEDEIICYYLLFGMLVMVSKANSENDPVLFQLPTVDRPHQMKHRIVNDDDDALNDDPTLRFLLRIMLAPFTLFTPDKKIHHHLSKWSAKKNSTDKQLKSPEYAKEQNATDKSSKSFNLKNN